MSSGVCSSGMFKEVCLGVCPMYIHGRISRGNAKGECTREYFREYVREYEQDGIFVCLSKGVCSGISPKG